MENSSNNLPFVSIIVPVYNGEKVIDECIEALLNQDYPKDKYEIIIVDNNSKDKTAEIIKKHPVKYVMEDKIQSSYAARNKGIQQSISQILAFTDADCVANKAWLTNLIKKWQDNVVGSAGEVVEPQPRTVIEKYHAGKYNQKQKLLESEEPYAMTANVAYKREIFDAVGLFNQELVTGGDKDFAQRVFRAGHKIQYNPDAKVMHKHRNTLRALYKQAKRHAFGRITSSVSCQIKAKGNRGILVRHFLNAVFRMVLVACYRILTVPFKGDKAYYLAMPFIRIFELYALFQGKRLGLKYISNKAGTECPYE